MTWSDTLEVILYFHYEYVGAFWWYFCKRFCELYPEAKCLQSENYFLVYLLATFVGSLGWKLFMVPVYNVFLQCAYDTCDLFILIQNSKLFWYVSLNIYHFMNRSQYYSVVRIFFTSVISKARSPSGNEGECVTGIVWAKLWYFK